MIQPELLFVHRLGVHEGVFRGRCICCDLHRPENWTRGGATWRGFILETAEPVLFRQAVTDWCPLDREPAEVYADEACSNGLPPEDQIALMNAQNYTYLVFDEIPSGLVPPFFISRVNPSTPVRLKVEVHMANWNIRSFPEVEDYKLTMRSQVRDRWDAMLVPKDSAEPLRIPVGLWLPASFVYGQRESGGVYAVSEWLDDEAALLEIACADRYLTVDTGCTLHRRFRTFDGHIIDLQLGTVRRIVGPAISTA